MASPSERIEQIERELQRYTAKKSSAKTLAAIGSSISERVKILNDVHDELIAISKELYYYDMVDYLGNLRIDALKLSQCLVLAKELDKAKQKFKNDKETKYLEQGEKLQKRVFWVGTNIIKAYIKNHEALEDIRNFYIESPESVKEKIRKHYFSQRIKDIERNIRACSEEVEKNYQLLIMGEVLAFEETFCNGVDTSMQKPGTFGFHILMVFKSICNKKNKDRIRAILKEISQKPSLTKIDELFTSAAKAHYSWHNTKSIEL
ncbi:uncharacterized protein VICG_01633 [Vittaforma corneae ATCC 50505]|uniref:Uncharacterized protein n=1 Tax=Vittaforma corneae (strain ATCC 50505) TaxID=993615 RepID=L2GM65_VITCO|nr:uncharacterized protein VICG_01633 [Vittaforma corneae ATCC 50505]ELA41392.1 hypothetical protein VICG_01633 [Vittaforma corneae ATCC 50505]